MLPNGAVERIAGEYERAWSESANGHAGPQGAIRGRVAALRAYGRVT